VTRQGRKKVLEEQVDRRSKLIDELEDPRFARHLTSGHHAVNQDYNFDRPGAAIK